MRNDLKRLRVLVAEINIARVTDVHYASLRDGICAEEDETVILMK